MTDAQKAAEAMREAAVQVVRSNGHPALAVEIRHLPLPEAPAVSEDVVERVARAICIAKGAHPDACVHGWGSTTGDHGCYLRAWQQETTAARAALAAMPPQGWCNDMENVPKDGTEILLLVKRRAGETRRCVVGHWMIGGFCIEDHPAIEAGWYFWNGYMFDKASEPLYWISLPAAPSPETGND